VSGRVVPLPTTTRVLGEATGAFLAQPDLAPSTRRSLIGYCRRRRRLVDDLTVDLDRRPDPADRTNAIPLPELERLWRRDDVGVREKAPWRLLYETAARAGEVLSINVEDLELDKSRPDAETLREVGREEPLEHRLAVSPQLAMMAAIDLCQEARLSGHDLTERSEVGLSIAMSSTQAVRLGSRNG
jgi:integrase